jgi:hypothetical protein
MQPIGGISASIPVQPYPVRENPVGNEEGQDEDKAIGHDGESGSDEPNENVQPNPDKGNNVSKFV